MNCLELTWPKPHCVFSPKTQFLLACISEKTTSSKQITNATEKIMRRRLSPFGSQFFTFMESHERLGSLSCFRGFLLAFAPEVLLMTRSIPKTSVTTIENKSHEAQRPNCPWFTSRAVLVIPKRTTWVSGLHAVCA